MKLSIARTVEAEHKLKVDYDSLVNPAKDYQNCDVGQRVYRSFGKLNGIFVTTNYDSWLDTEITDVPLSTT